MHLTAWRLTKFWQELGQSGISLIRKHQLKVRFEKMQGEFAAVAKAKTVADQKMVSLLPLLLKIAETWRPDRRRDREVLRDQS